MMRKQNMHKMKISFMTIIAAAAIVIAPMASMAAPSSYPDVPKSNSHYDAITALTDQDVIKGYENGDFGVWDDVSRMQVAVMLTNILELPIPDNIADTLDVYSDMDEDSLYAEEIAAVTKAGIFTGDSGDFHSIAKITREQTATVLTLGFSLEEHDTDGDIPANLDDVYESHLDRVQTIINLGTSTQSERFRPGENITRGAFSTMLYVTQKIVKGHLSPFEQQVVDLTNKERVKQGLTPLEVSEPLSKAAYVKSHDMAVNEYFSHLSPTIGNLGDLLEQEGIDYSIAGENIAKGYMTPESVVHAWMNSPGHRDNILTEEYEYIGVGFDKSGYYWTQEFIAK